MDMEDLLCPQISMDVDDTPLELGVEIEENDDNSEAGASEEMPVDVKIKILLDTEQFDASQIPEPLTEEEEALKKTVFNLGPAVQFTKLHCTSCNQHLGSAPVNQFNRFIHPLLHVLLCKSCYDFYCSGEFEKDKDGSELYCRWCGQGGKVMCCSDCCFVFCQKCVRTNLGKKTLDGIKNAEDWKCFVCNPQQLINLKLICHSLYRYVIGQIKLAKETNNEDILTKDESLCCKQIPRQTRPSKRKRSGSNDEKDSTYVPYVEDFKKVKFVKPPTIPSPSVPKLNGQVFNPMSIRTPTMVNNFIRINPIAMGIPKLVPFAPKPRMFPPVQQRPNISDSQNYIAPPNPQLSIRPRLPHRFKSVISSVPSSVTPGMKHNWFDQASSLTTNVTNQLLRKLMVFNLEQRSASSIEKLAGIHNQLQELLSNSVNQLIHIRKNLRSEFLSDLNKLKAARSIPTQSAISLIPLKPPQSVTKDDDDDVILVQSEEKDPLAISELSVEPKTTGENKQKPFLKLRPVSTLMAMSSTENTTHIDLCDDDDDDDPVNVVEQPHSSPTNEVENQATQNEAEDEGCELLTEGEDATRKQKLRALFESTFEAAVEQNRKIKITADPRLTPREVEKMLKVRVIVDPKYIPKQKPAKDNDIFLSDLDLTANSDELIGVSEDEAAEINTENTNEQLTSAMNSFEKTNDDTEQTQSSENTLITNAFLSINDAASMIVDDDTSDECNKVSQSANSENYDRRKSVSDIEASADPVTTTDSGIEVDAK